MTGPHKTGRPPTSAEERRRRMRERVLKRHGRWTPTRKAELCTALRAAIVTIEEAVERCGLHREEIAAWLKTFARSGTDGLRIYGRRAA